MKWLIPSNHIIITKEKTMRKVFTFSMATTDGEFINKVESIKGLRVLMGIGLREAKEFSEEVYEKKTLTKAIDIVCAPEAMSEIMKQITYGGISVIDNDGAARALLLSDIKDITARAVDATQYDIARSLILILETTAA